MNLPPNFEYFESSREIEKLIKEQGDIICQNKIGHEYMLNSLTEYTFGFAHKSVRAEIGQKKKKSSQKILYSFILCEPKPDGNLVIHLICSRENARDGKKLIELVCMKAMEMGFHRVSLLSILDDKLVRWYKSQGFYVYMNMYRDSELKTYLMYKDL